MNKYTLLRWHREAMKRTALVFGLGFWLGLMTGIIWFGIIIMERGGLLG